MANDLLFASTLMIQLPTHDIGSVFMSLKDGQCSFQGWQLFAGRNVIIMAVVGN